MRAPLPLLEQQVSPDPNPNRNRNRNPNPNPNQDLMTLFDRLTHGGMKDSIQAEVLRKQGEGLVLKERRYRGDMGEI